MKKYVFILTALMLMIGMSACGKSTDATEPAANEPAVPVDGGATDNPAAPTNVPGTPSDGGDLGGDEMAGFVFAPMPGEYEPQVDVWDFIGTLREEADISGDLQIISAMPAGTTWESVLAHYQGQATNNGWTLSGTKEMTTSKGSIGNVALFTYGKYKILLVYYPLNNEIVIIQIQGE
ncbi:MAG: hypothetical protein HYZ23_08125 [Chloroflexi bacterium]|nr:hypothetical protein [Chloroflexota bacterium]